jgi:hypothetical protein
MHGTGGETFIRNFVGKSVSKYQIGEQNRNGMITTKMNVRYVGCRDGMEVDDTSSASCPVPGFDSGGVASGGVLPEC